MSLFGFWTKTPGRAIAPERAAAGVPALLAAFGEGVLVDGLVPVAGLVAPRANFSRDIVPLRDFFALDGLAHHDADGLVRFDRLEADLADVFGGRLGVVDE